MKIVILGGVAAGAKAAAKLRRLLPEVQIDLYTNDTHVSYSACGLCYYIQGNFEDYQTLLVRSPEEFEKQNIHIHLQNEAIQILPDKKQVLIKNLVDDTVFTVDYDKLIIATGARPIIPTIKNAHAKNVFSLRRIEDGIAIREKALNSKKVVIIGSGYIGLELLEAFVALGLHVTVLEFQNTILPNFDEDISRLIYNKLMQISDGRFELKTSEFATEFILDENENVISVQTATGSHYDADMVIISAGVKPNVELLRDTGIATGETGAIKVNRHMQTNYHEIYACGDCAEKTLLINEAKIWIPLGSTANKEGRIAALSIAGYDDEFDGILASSVFRCLSYTVSRTGMTEKMATHYGFNPISVTVTKHDRVGYMPNADNMTLKLIADKSSGLLLGGTAVGSLAADKRINTLASALLARMTIKEFARNDLTYAPPFSPTIDPLLDAASLLYRKYLDEKG